MHRVNNTLQQTGYGKVRCALRDTHAALHLQHTLNYSAVLSHI